MAPNSFRTPGVAVLIGSASGIGKATALAYARNGARGLVLADFNEPGVQKTAAQAKQEATHEDFAVIALHVDVRDYASVENVFEEAVKKFGRIDYSVTAAGIFIGQGFLAENPLDLYDNVQETNAKGILHHTKAAIRVMLKQEPLVIQDVDRARIIGRGAIVNICSIAGLVSVPGNIEYVASKFAAVGITKTAASEYGSSQIRINAVCPGAIETPLLERALALAPESRTAFTNGASLKRANFDSRISLKARKVKFYPGTSCNAAFRTNDVPLCFDDIHVLVNALINNSAPHLGIKTRQHWIKPLLFLNATGLSIVIMAGEDIQKAEEARVRGNGLYKTGKLSDAIKAYTEACELDNATYLPLSNLSAAYYEVGKYHESIVSAKKTLQMIAETPESETAKQKLLVRMAKGFLYLQNLEITESIVDAIESESERANLRCSVERIHAMQGDDDFGKSGLRLGLMKLPRYKPQMNDETEYFCVGHDTPESQLAGDLIRNLKPDEPASILFCGIGDARNMFQTIIELPDDQTRRLQFTVLDHKPSVIARNLIFFHLFNEAAMEKDEEKSRLLFRILAYLFTVSIIPPFVWEKLQMTTTTLLDDLESGNQPIAWANIGKEYIKPLCRVLRQWKPVPKGSYSPENIRGLVARGQLVNEIDSWGSDWKFNHQFFKDFGTVKLHPSDAERVEPHLAGPLRAYLNKAQGGKAQLSTYINNTWETNITMIDIDWEDKRGGFGEPDMSMNPLMTAEMLSSAMAKTQYRKYVMKGSVVEAIVRYFALAGSKFRRMHERLQVEVRIQEMADALESMRCDLLQNPEPGSDIVPGGGAQPPRRYHNPPRWDSINQYLAEYLLMYDRKRIESHFHVKLSVTTPEEYEDDMYPLMPYYKWERVTAPPKTLKFEELMPQASLTRWLYSHFLKICLPYERGPAFDLVYAPLNLTMFMRLLVHVSELGYPAHWLSTLINNLLGGEVTTTARAPRRYVLTTQDVDKVHPPRKVSVKPWTMEFAALISLWQHLLPFGLISSSHLLAPLDEMHEYTVKFPHPFFHPESGHVPHFMLVFWNQQKLESPLQTSARFVRSEVVRVVTTFNWSTDARAATFWLRRGDMAEMVGQD
ncbi:hypothetical protein PG997_006686 [Apiospora hydei]|uniref:DUF4470 domain-containing protein n=1 Tax=Apiospora hydei TaxID=1337664 RepID=A0ABR1WRR4_9PEZI